MLTFFNKRLRNREGFTLIELIVVIAILGILAAIAVPRFTGVQSTANQKANEANIATLRSAAEISVAENGAPAADVTWTALETGTAPHLASEYLSTWPAPPTGYTAYTVKITGSAGVVSVTQ